MKQLKFLIGTFLLSLSFNLSAQMLIDGETKWGNEWINFDQDYYKFLIKEDGVYKITGAELSAAGLNIGSINGSEIQVYNFGKKVPIYVSTDGPLTENDFVLLEGKRNDGELDKQLYGDIANNDWEEMQFNTEYSLFSDNSAYFLTWSGEIQENHLTMVDNSLDDNLPLEEYYIHTEEQIFNDFFIKKTYNGDDKVRLSDYDQSEGFGSTLLNKKTFGVSTSRRADVGIDPTIEIRLTSNNTAHELEVTVEGQIIDQAIFSGNVVRQINETFPHSLLDNNTSVVVDGIPAQDKYSVGYIKLNYARDVRFNNGEQYVNFNVEANSSNKRFSIVNFLQTDDMLYAIDFEDRTIREVPFATGNKRNFEVNNITERKKVHLASEQGFKQVPGITKERFFDFTQINPQYVVITSERLMNESYEGRNLIQEYVDYRASEKGGGYDVHVFTSEQLIDQFAYGVERNPLSGNNWSNYLVDQWTNWEFLFTIGKGVEYSVSRTDEQLNNPLNPPLHVPTWGVPGSDNLQYGRRGQSAPNVATGRIAALSAEDIDIYLDKVKLHESVLDEGYDAEETAWTKKIIHLSGGDAAIQTQIFNWLEQLKLIIEDDVYGAEVTTFRKSSTDLLQAADSEEILNAINDGVSIITFFGHSAVGTFDFSLEAASEYDNTGKYPLLVSLGCHSGNIHASGSDRGLSEEFVFERDKGSIAFLASTSTAYIGPQYVTGQTLYRNISTEFYGEPIGKALKSYYDDNALNQTIPVLSLNQQMTYHGDPAIAFPSFEAPDYVVDKKSIRLNPNTITTSDETFDFSFDVLNLGKAIDSTINVKITHTIPDGTTFEFNEEIPAPKFREGIQLTIQNQGLASLGRNLINIEVDNDNRVEELPDPSAEANNVLSDILQNEGFEFFVESNIAKPVSPAEFAIVSDADVTLISATTNLFSDSTDYILQIDTSELFLSPIKSSIISKGFGGKISWKPEIQMENEEVYYWRVSPNSTLDSNYIWRNSSFVYLPEKQEGWNQSHFYQFLKDDFDQLTLTAHEQMQFDTNGFFIRLDNFLFDSSNPPYYQFNAESPAASIKPWNFMNDGGVAIVVGDAINGGAWKNENVGEYGSIISGNANQTSRVFGFETDTPENRKEVVDFIELIPEESYVWFISVFKFEDNDLHTEEWSGDTLIYGSSIFKALEGQQANLTSEFEEYGNVPYTFVFQKDREALDEDIGNTLYDHISTNTFIPISDVQGTLNSTLVGPAVSWSHLEWDVDGFEENDSVSVTVTGINELGEETEIAQLTNPSIYDLSEISASTFPYMRLDYFAYDEVERTAAQLKYWRVYFEEYPEAIFNPEAEFSFQSDTLTQGDFLRFRANVENVTDTPMDDLLVHYTIIDEENNEIFNAKFEDKILANGDIDITFNYPSAALKGDYQFIVEFNPDYAQKEQFIFNNLGIKNFFVKGSTLNPDLEVTFDDKRIFDGDVVSPDPEIKISLYDNNRFLFNTDPENFQQAILFPDGSRVDYKMPDDLLEFVPGSEANNNVACMYLRPEGLETGEYTFVAQAKNASGIFSGEQAYAVNFRVLGNSCISDFHNYPNPFSISELYNTGIGTDRLLYEWDGSAQDGSQLPNGMYFYRLVINGNVDNKGFKNCSSDVEGHLFGKVVLMN